MNSPTMCYKQGFGVPVQRKGLLLKLLVTLAPCADRTIHVCCPVPRISSSRLVGEDRHGEVELFLAVSRSKARQRRMAWSTQATPNDSTRPQRAMIGKVLTLKPATLIKNKQLGQVQS